MSEHIFEVPDNLTPSEETWFKRFRAGTKAGLALMGSGVVVMGVGIATNEVNIGMGGDLAVLAGIFGFTTSYWGVRGLEYKAEGRPQAEQLPLEYSHDK